MVQEIVVSVIVLLALVVVVRRLVQTFKKPKEGQSPCGGCAGCAFYDNCSESDR